MVWRRLLDVGLLNFYCIERLRFLLIPSDNSLFTFTQNCNFVAILVYVDDILVTGTHIHLINTITFYLTAKFQLKDLGPLRYFLGIKVVRFSVPQKASILVSTNMPRIFCRTLDLLMLSPLSFLWNIIIIFRTIPVPYSVSL